MTSSRQQCLWVQTVRMVLLQQQGLRSCSFEAACWDKHGGQAFSSCVIYGSSIKWKTTRENTEGNAKVKRVGSRENKSTFQKNAVVAVEGGKAWEIVYSKSHLDLTKPPRLAEMHFCLLHLAPRLQNISTISGSQTSGMMVTVINKLLGFSAVMACYGVILDLSINLTKSNIFMRQQQQ